LDVSEKVYNAGWPKAYLPECQAKRFTAHPNAALQHRTGPFHFIATASFIKGFVATLQSRIAALSQLVEKAQGALHFLGASLIVVWAFCLVVFTHVAP
jgi:hypothetical protein